MRKIIAIILLLAALAVRGGAALADGPMDAMTWPNGQARYELDGEELLLTFKGMNIGEETTDIAVDGVPLGSDGGLPLWAVVRYKGESYVSKTAGMAGDGTIVYHFSNYSFPDKLTADDPPKIIDLRGEARSVILWYDDGGCGVEDIPQWLAGTEPEGRTWLLIRERARTPDPENALYAVDIQDERLPEAGKTPSVLSGLGYMHLYPNGRMLASNDARLVWPVSDYKDVRVKDAEALCRFDDFLGFRCPDGGFMPVPSGERMDMDFDEEQGLLHLTFNTLLKVYYTRVSMDKVEWTTEPLEITLDFLLLQ